MLESKYRRKLVSKLSGMFPGIVIVKNDPTQLQGIPDLLLLYGEQWAMLEVKMSQSADVQPNQEFHVNLFNSMSFAAFIYPENEGEVLRALQFAFGHRG